MHRNNQNYLLTISATQNFYLMGRMLNILTRNQIKVEHLSASLTPDEKSNYHVNSFKLFTSPENAEKVSKQMRRLVEVDKVSLQIL